MACITPLVTVKGFKKRCTSIAMDRTDYNVLYNNSEQDGNVGSVDEDTDCDDGVNNTDW